MLPRRSLRLRTRQLNILTASHSVASSSSSSSSTGETSKLIVKSAKKRARAESSLNVDGGSQPKQKKRRINPRINLESLPVELLDKICMHLNVESFHSVADTSERLRLVANDVFKRKYGDHLIEISGCDDYRPKTRAYVCGQGAAHVVNPSETSIYCRDEKKIYRVLEIQGLKPSLKFLRCFGSSIKHLNITYSPSITKRYGYVHQYVNEFCAKSLVRLWFDQMPITTTIDQFQSIFEKVEKITIWKCNLSKQWANFFKLFPNLHWLTILDAHGHAVGKRSRNRDIRSPPVNKGRFWLKNENKISLDELMDAIKDNRSITKLALLTDSITVKEVVQPCKIMVKRFVSEHPVLVGLFFVHHQLTAEDVIELIHQLIHRKNFDLSCYGRNI